MEYTIDDVKEVQDSAKADLDYEAAPQYRLAKIVYETAPEGMDDIRASAKKAIDAAEDPMRLKFSQIIFDACNSLIRDMQADLDAEAQPQ